MRLLDRSERGHVLASGALVAGAAGMAAIGLFAAFANATPFGHHAVKQRPRLSVAPHRLASVGPLAPGDQAERTVELRYRGRFAAVVLTTRAVPGSLLDSSAKTGLQLGIQRCSARWQRKRGGRSYVCRGKRSTVLATRPVHGKRRLVLRHLSRRPSRTDHLLLVLGLPAVAGNDLQSQRSKLDYRFTGVAAG